MSNKPKQEKTDLELAAEYEAKAKALRRREKDFKDTVLKRKTEVETWLNMSDKFDEICILFGVESDADKNKLFGFLTQDRTVQYFHEHYAKGTNA